MVQRFKSETPIFPMLTFTERGEPGGGCGLACSGCQVNVVGLEGGAQDLSCLLSLAPGRWM